MFPQSPEQDPIFNASPASRLNAIDVQNLKVLPNVIENIKRKAGVKGDRGENGRTPRKGVDYFTKQETEAFLKATTPVKGVHYHDGKSIIGPKGEKGDRGEKGDQGEKGDRGEKGDAPIPGIDFPLPKDGRDGIDGTNGEDGRDGKNGINGQDGKDGKNGKDGRDGNDAEVDMEKVKKIAKQPISAHEKAFGHSLIHSPFALGSYQVDEEGVGHRKVLTFDAKRKKLVYAMPKDFSMPINHEYHDGGTILPSRESHIGDFLRATINGYEWGPETDPIFLASVAAAITNTDISHWDDAYGWGDHALAGYIKSVTAHNLLSATHGDTLTGSVVAGDIIYGNSTPKWARLAKGNNGQSLRLASGLPAWETVTHHLRFTLLDPASAYAKSATIPIWVKTDAAITITNLEVSCDANPATEPTGDIKYADAVIGLANAAVINDFDTTDGARTDSSISSGSVASGKCIYISFDAAPDAAIKYMVFDLTFNY